MFFSLFKNNIWDKLCLFYYENLEKNNKKKKMKIVKNYELFVEFAEKIFKLIKLNNIQKCVLNMHQLI